MIEIEEKQNGDIELKIVNRKQFLNLIKTHEEDTTTLFELLLSSSYIGNGYEVLVNEDLPTIGFGAMYDDYGNFSGYIDEWVGQSGFIKELKKYNFVTFFAKNLHTLK